MIRTIAFGLAITVCSACGNNRPQAISGEGKNALMFLGDSIAKEMQNVLLQNLSEAMQKGGTDYAVEFCNLIAIPLTDSMANRHQVQIQRLSDKNRNPDNAIQTQMDSLAWAQIKAEKTGFIRQHKSGAIYYYKPIAIAMPTCIKCHGNNADIPESTQKIITEKYPNDKATGYAMGDIRGMWKIKINTMK